MERQELWFGNYEGKCFFLDNDQFDSIPVLFCQLPIEQLHLFNAWLRLLETIDKDYLKSQRPKGPFYFFQFFFILIEWKYVFLSIYANSSRVHHTAVFSLFFTRAFEHKKSLHI